MKKFVFWKRALRLVFDLLFPINCIGCGQPETWLCPKCQAGIGPYSGKKISIPGINRVKIATNYENQLVQKAIHLLKYKSAQGLAEPLSWLIRNHIVTNPNNLIIPVPLHRRRTRERGFNQSALIAEYLPGILRTEILIRKKHTRPQMKLDREERLHNLDKAFELKRPGDVLGRDIILIDDVLTTGKTLSECASAIRAGKPRSITAAVIAHGR